MVSISIDPEQDTPEALARYAKRFDAGPQWVFLTGSLEDSIRVQKAFDAYRGDKMNHVPLTLLRTGPDTDWVRYDGFASGADLVTELRAGIDLSVARPWLDIPVPWRVRMATALRPPPGVAAGDAAPADDVRGRYPSAMSLDCYLSALTRQGKRREQWTRPARRLGRLGHGEPRMSEEEMSQPLGDSGLN